MDGVSVGFVQFWKYLRHDASDTAYYCVQGSRSVVRPRARSDDTPPKDEGPSDKGNIAAAVNSDSDNDVRTCLCAQAISDSSIYQPLPGVRLSQLNLAKSKSGGPHPYNDARSLAPLYGLTFFLLAVARTGDMLQIARVLQEPNLRRSHPSSVSGRRHSP